MQERNRGYTCKFVLCQCRASFSPIVFHQMFHEKATHLYDAPNFDTFLNSVLTDSSMDRSVYRLAFEVDRLQHLMDAVALVT